MAQETSKQALFEKLTIKTGLQVFVYKAQEALEELIASNDLIGSDPQIRRSLKDALKWLALVDSVLALVDDTQAADIPF